MSWKRKFQVTLKTLNKENKTISRLSMEQKNNYDLKSSTNNWQWHKFSTVCTRVSVGYVGPTTKFFSTNKELGIPLIRSQNVRPGKLIIENTAKITTSFHESIKKSNLLPGDILIVRVGANRGDCCIVPDDFGELNCANIVFASPKKKTRFYEYYFRSEMGKKALLSNTTGAAQGVINTGSVANILVPVPSDEVQAHISSIISSYDDLINNNEKRIRILEDIAQRFYTEWFVKFKFPGHEKVKMIESPLGKIPENWNVKRTDEVAKVIRGTSYSSEEIDDNAGDFYFVNLKSFNRGGGFRFDGIKYFNGRVKDEQLLKRGEIVVAVTDMTTDRAVISRPARIPNIRSRKITFSADVVKIVPQEIPLAFTYYTLLDYRFTETTKNKANGANVLHLKPGAISEYKIILPDKKLLDEFERMCINIVELKDNLSEENEKLVKIRDLLIPQLVTGKRKL